MDSQHQQFETRSVHTGVAKDSSYNSVITPIYPSSTFYWDDLQTTKGYDYTRSGNPTRTGLEQNIAALEGGIDCRATCTGMSAITAVLHMFQPGDHIIASDDIYGGTYRLFADVFTRQGLEFSFVRMTDATNVTAALKPNTKCVWIETPSNPLLNIVDIAAVVEIAQSAGAITIADNTFLSPYLQRPFEFGVDIVLHSTTKYINGHSDVVGGAIVTRTQEHAERVAYLVNALGLACSPFDAWLVLRGVKTLAPRMEAHQRGAMALAEMLDAHPAVEKVYYPGVESLFEYPESMSHASMTLDARRQAGITEKTIRVSVGIENPDDLVADMKQALDSI
jgi:cystathionine beta-lyase/cystathionine gamma-synthase